MLAPPLLFTWKLCYEKAKNKIPFKTVCWAALRLGVGLDLSVAQAIFRTIQKEASHPSCLSPKTSLDHLCHRLAREYGVSVSIPGIFSICRQTHLQLPEENILLNPWQSGEPLRTLLGSPHKARNPSVHNSPLQLPSPQTQRALVCSWVPPDSRRRVTSNKWGQQWKSLGVRAGTSLCYFSVRKLLGTHTKHPRLSPFLTQHKKQRRNLIFHEYQITLSICGRQAASLLTFNNWTKLSPASIRVNQGFRYCRYWDEFLPAQFISIHNLYTKNCGMCSLAHFTLWAMDKVIRIHITLWPRTWHMVNKCLWKEQMNKWKPEWLIDSK